MFLDGTFRAAGRREPHAGEHRDLRHANYGKARSRVDDHRGASGRSRENSRSQRRSFQHRGGQREGGLSGVEGVEREDHDGREAGVKAVATVRHSLCLDSSFSGRIFQLALGAKNLAEFAVESNRLLRSLVEHFHPAASAGGKFCLRNQVARLQDGFERVAQIVGERSEFACDFGGDPVFGGHGGACRSRAAGLTVRGQPVDINVVPLKTLRFVFPKCGYGGIGRRARFRS
jgi:hypothetical protein